MHAIMTGVEPQTVKKVVIASCKNTGRNITGKKREIQT